MLLLRAAVVVVVVVVSLVAKKRAMQKCGRSLPRRVCATGGVFLREAEPVQEKVDRVNHLRRETTTTGKEEEEKERADILGTARTAVRERPHGQSRDWSDQ